MKQGDRVGAVMYTQGDEAKIYGYGVYVGDHVPPKDVGGFNMGFPNPRLDLDNGETVWGCECWWGPEEKIKKMLEGKTVEVVKPDRLEVSE